ncbi:MAG: hypothetical protein VX913_01760 [Planctomycetota bacterium]|nr:hypothetical protein [Planctomycetota bacterium]
MNVVVNQYLSGGPPFLGPLSSTGEATYSALPPSGIASLSGQTWYGVTFFFTPGTLYSVGYGDVLSHTFQ